MKTFKFESNFYDGCNWKSTFFNYTSESLGETITARKSMFEIKCTDCGKTALVPFKPTADKPVYCKACFSKHKLKLPENPGKSSGFDPKQAWARRRDKEQRKKEAEPTRVFQWSYSVNTEEGSSD
jgi:CxxC-x17-CxxC domain-containing protein